MTPKALAQLHAVCFATPRPWNAEEFAALIGAPDCDLITLPGGFALIRSIAGEAELLTIAVDPDRCREGIGGRLLARALIRAQAKGAETCFLEVAADNAAAIGLYRSAGFTQTGRRPGYYRLQDGQRTDAVIMARPLGPTAVA